MSRVSPLEHTAVGALAGLMEVTIMMPTVGIKNALQEGRAIPRTIPGLYRGYGITAGAMLPIVATQFGVNRMLEQTYTNVTGYSPGAGGRIVVAMGAGSASAVFGCTAEFDATILRESLYAAGYLGVMPIIRSKLEEIPAVNDIPGGPLAASGLTAGILATVTTHPADTIKTRMQAFPDAKLNPEYRTLMSTTRHIYQTEGLGTFFHGLLPRAARIICAVFILTGTRNTVIGALEKSRSVSIT